MRSQLQNKRVENIKQAHRLGGGFLYTLSRDGIGLVVSVDGTYSRHDIASRLIDARRTLQRHVAIAHNSFYVK